MSTPLAIDRVERSRAKKDQVRLRLTGHWLGAGPDPDTEALLVVQLHGARHRFPASRDERETPGGSAGPVFTASFTIPDWAVPEQVGQAVLWVGDAVVAVPPPGTSAPAQPDVAPAPASAPVPVGPLASAGPDQSGPVADDAGAQPPASDPSAEAESQAAGRAGPLADLLYKETVAALHTELEVRGGEAARLRAELAQLRSDLEGRAGATTRLQEAHAELRGELGQLMTAAAGQRGEFDRRLASVEAERDGAREGLNAARAELEAAHAELETVRAQLEAVGAELEAARAEAQSAYAEAQSARDEAQAAQEEARAARSQAESELSTDRAESEAMLAAARAESEAMLSAARAEGEARIHEAEQRAAQLAERLQSLSAADRRHADEGSALREQLAAAHVARDAALGEAAGLRAELERLGSELAVVREQGTAPGGDLDEARQLLADARALTERLSGRSAG
jgi:hypothetical protein